jgi:ribosomal protein S1
VSSHRDLELAAELAEVPVGHDPAIGSLIRVTVREHQSYGIVCDIEGSEDLVGLLTPPHQPSTRLKVGETCSAAVLDVYKLDGIVDLSAREVRLHHLFLYLFVLS